MTGPGDTAAVAADCLLAHARPVSHFISAQISHGIKDGLGLSVSRFYFQHF